MRNMRPETRGLGIQKAEAGMTAFLAGAVETSASNHNRPLEPLLCDVEFCSYLPGGHFLDYSSTYDGSAGPTRVAQDG